MISYITRQLGRAIDRLREDLREALQEQTRSIRDSAETADKKREEIPRIISSAIRSAQDTPAYEKTQRDKEYRQQNRLIIATWCAFGAAAIYAGIAAVQLHSSNLQLGETRKANQLTQKAMKESHRPWIGVQDNVVFDEKNISWVGEQGQAIVQKMAAENKLPIRVLYSLKNSGYGPALNTMLVIQPIMFSQQGSDESQIRAMIEESCKIAEQRISQGNGDLMLPAGEHSVPYQFGTWDSTKFLFTPGCIVYRDVDGGLHHTRICYAASLFVSPTPKGLESCQDQSAD